MIAAPEVVNYNLSKSFERAKLYKVDNSFFILQWEIGFENTCDSVLKGKQRTPRKRLFIGYDFTDRDRRNMLGQVSPPYIIWENQSEMFRDNLKHFEWVNGKIINPEGLECVTIEHFTEPVREILRHRTPKSARKLLQEAIRGYVENGNGKYRNGHR